MASRASLICPEVRTLVEGITNSLGFDTDIKKVFKPGETVRDNQPYPYAIVRSERDERTGTRPGEATRIRHVSIEIFFGLSAAESALDNAHADILRALDIGRTPIERKFPFQIADFDEVEFDYGGDGGKLKVLKLVLPVNYVENYN